MQTHRNWMQKPLALQKLLANVAVQNYSKIIFNENYKLVNFKNNKYFQTLIIM